jgi:hypothetical protein
MSSPSSVKSQIIRHIAAPVEKEHPNQSSFQNFFRTVSALDQMKVSHDTVAQLELQETKENKSAGSLKRNVTPNIPAASGLKRAPGASVVPP